MARLWTAGGESNDALGVERLVTATPMSATTVRSGALAFKHDTGASNIGAASQFSFTGAVGTTHYLRVYVNFAALPSSVSSNILRLSATGFFQVSMSTSGTLQLAYGGANIGSPTAALNTGQWYRLELAARTNAGANAAYVEFLLDGVSIATSSTVNDSGAFTSLNFGWIVGVGANTVVYADDVALNDDTGAAQNTWPGDGKVVLLLPISDNSAGSWRAGSAASAAANGALFDAINNTPPVGTVSPDAVTACISNTISGATAPNGDFNLTSYTTAGIGAGDTINCLQMTVAHGEDSATGTKTGTFNVQSNPLQSGTDAIVQFGPAASGAVGAYRTNWVIQQGTNIYAPSVTVGTSPVGRITKTDTGTRAADCCYMGLYVDYTPVVVSDILLGQACL